MNELIEELFEQYARLFMNDKCEMLFTDFKQVIQTACKAQRNACARRFQDELDKRIHGGNSIRTILTAEIERQDYE